MANVTLFIQAKTGDPAIQYDGLSFRKFVAATYPIEGVLGVGQLKVTQRGAGANMSVDVAAGGAVVKCDSVANGGSYLTFEDAVANVAIPGAPTSGSRTHLIVEQVNDPQSDGGSNYTSAPICIEDTGSGATLPESAYLLARVTVSAGQASVTNAMIADQRNQAAGPPPYKITTWSTTLSGAGRIIVPHGLDVEPSGAWSQGTTPGQYTYFVIAKDDTNVTIQAINPTTNQPGVGGQASAGFLIAFR